MIAQQVMAANGVTLSRIQRLFLPSDIAALFDPSVSALYSTGIATLSAEVDGPVGARLDVSRGMNILGPERANNGDFAAGTTGWGPAAGRGTFTVTDGIATLTDNGTNISFPNNIMQTASPQFKFVELRFSITSGILKGWLIGTDIGNRFFDVNLSPGNYVHRFQIGDNSSLRFNLYCTSNGTVSLDSVSLREILGDPSYQMTTSFRPTLRVTASGKRWLEAPTTDTALNVRYLTAPGECDVGVLNGDGSFTWTRPSLGTTVNTLGHLAFNAFWIMRKRAFDPNERALIERYAQRFAPAPGEWT